MRIIDLLSEAILEQSGEGARLVLAVDDFQNLDSLSIDVVAASLRKAASREAPSGACRLLVLLAGEAGAADGQSWVRAWREDYQSVRIDLRGLDRDDILDQCMRAGMPGAPLSVREELHQKTEGNPFLVRWALDRCRAEGASRLVPFLGRSSAAFDAVGLFSQSWRDLAEEERRVLEMLAIASRPCSLEELSGYRRAVPEDAAPADSTQADDGWVVACTSLSQGGWLIEDVRADGVSVWSLAGAALRGWILEKLRPAEALRCESLWTAFLLRRANEQGDRAEWFEVFHLLSRHGLATACHQAGRQAAALAERVGDFDTAADVLRRISTYSATAGLHQGCFNDRIRLAELLEIAESPLEAIEVLKNLTSRDGELVSAEQRAGVFRFMGRLHGRMEDPEAEAQCYLRGMQELEGVPDSSERIKLCAHLARSSVQRGDAAAGREYLARAVEAVDAGAEPTGPDGLETLCLVGKAFVSFRDYAASKRMESRTLQAAKQLGDVYSVFRSMTHSAHVALLAGNGHDASSHYEDALRAAREIGSRYLEAKIQAELGDALNSRGDSSANVEPLERSRTIFYELGARRRQKELEGKLASIHFDRHDLEAGIPLLVSSLEEGALENTSPSSASPTSGADLLADERRARIAGFKEWCQRGAEPTPSALRAHADLLVESGTLREAEQYYHLALRTSRSGLDPVETALTLQRLGNCLRLRGEPQQAMRAFESSLERLRPVPVRGIVADAYLEVGALLWFEGDLSRGLGYFLKGQRIHFDSKDRAGRLRCLLRWMAILRDLGYSALSESVGTHLVRCCREGGLRRLEAEAEGMLGGVLSEQGQEERAIRCFEASQAGFQATGASLGLARTELELAWSCLRRQEYERGLERARSGLECARAVGAESDLYDWLHVIGVLEGMIGSRRRSFLRAVQVLQQALDGLRRQRRWFSARRALVTLARVYLLRGKADVAREYLIEEAKLFEAVRERLPDSWVERCRVGVYQKVATDEGCPLDRLLVLRRQVHDLSGASSLSGPPPEAMELI
jgi:tetratricopeptide (TPR) repeat protein